jgi:hypothetical protein
MYLWMGGWWLVAGYHTETIHFRILNSSSTSPDRWTVVSHQAQPGSSSALLPSGLPSAGLSWGHPEQVPQIVYDEGQMTLNVSLRVDPSPTQSQAPFIIYLFTGEVCDEKTPLYSPLRGR